LSKLCGLGFAVARQGGLGGHVGQGGAWDGEQTEAEPVEDVRLHVSGVVGGGGDWYEAFGGAFGLVDDGVSAVGGGNRLVSDLGTGKLDLTFFPWYDNVGLRVFASSLDLGSFEANFDSLHKVLLGSSIVA